MQETLLNQRYRLLEKVGEGGMAEVFRAEDTLLERIVAVKLLRQQYVADPEFLARFQQEARSVAKLSHPNVVSVFDVGSDGPANYIVIEYVEGRDLKSLIRREAPLGVGQAVDTAMAVLAALNFAHQKGLIHRDVKPQNILVGADGQVKVADFGIARAVNAPQTTATGVVMATVQYCSPEQAMGKGATAASDIYSVGVILYEMLTGKLPFEADSALAIALKHLQEQPPSPRELNPLIPRRLEAIILQALAKEPERRFQTAADMRQALQTYQQFGQEATTTFRAVAPPVAGVDPQGAAVARRVRPQPRAGVDWLAIILGALVLALIIGAVPLALKVYSIYGAGRGPLDPTAPPVTVQPAPTYTAAAEVVPTTTPGTPTQTPTPTTTPTPAPTVTVPKVTGLPYEQARSSIEAKGLKVRISGESFSADQVPMIVLSQSPQPDSVLSMGSMVEVVVSKGTDRVTVENVVGLSLADARSKLEALGLTVDQTEQWNNQASAGVVVSQQPVSGDSLPRGGVVLLVVSKGVQPTPTPTPVAVRPPEGDYSYVPDLVGLPEAEARRRIELAGLTTTYTNYQVESDVPPDSRAFFRTIPPGCVVSADHRPGERMPKGSVIKIAVRKQ